MCCGRHGNSSARQPAGTRTCWSRVAAGDCRGGGRRPHVTGDRPCVFSGSRRRYAAYGLNVHEALCRGMAVMVTRTAGVAERFDAAMTEALLPAQITPGDLAAKLAAWRGDVDGWRARTAATAARIRARTWDHMA